MYTQFFGNYLLTNGYVTKEQLFDAMKKQEEAHMRLGTLAIHKGLMTTDAVEEIVILQTHESKKFGELAVENGYLTEDELTDLLQEQSPDFLLLAQILVDDGIISPVEMDSIIATYKDDNEIIELDMTADQHDIIMNQIDNLFIDYENLAEECKSYFELLFNDFIRFVGEDFTTLPAEKVDVFPVDCASTQTVLGKYNIKSIISMDEETAIAFASRYVGESFIEYDEYVQASLEDFLNLHNGLFIVNVSNSDSIELNITAPEKIEDPIIDFANETLHFQVMYSFGLVHFLIELLPA